MTTETLRKKLTVLLCASASLWYIRICMSIVTVIYLQTLSDTDQNPMRGYQIIVL